MLTMIRSKNFFLKHKPLREDPQIFDLLQLSKKERESRILCLSAIRQLDHWKKNAKWISDPSLKLYMRAEGIFLRRKAQKAVIFYRSIRNDRMRSFENYMNKLPSRCSVLHMASR